MSKPIQTFAGERLTLSIATLNPRAAEKPGAAPARLRFDKVAIRLVERLKASCDETVPDGMTVLLTVTAPIRLASKTAAALEDKIPTLLARRTSGRDQTDTVHGNRVRIRLLSNQLADAPKFIAFIHNSDSDALALLNLTHDFLDLLAAAARTPAPEPPRDRWLIVINPRDSSLEAYRAICSQLPDAGFEKILMAFADGRVEILAG